ncbi:MAG: PTS sugar transporter subunit IIB [Hespellia sp.]|nr:PTS sugar transporter subunit IIB [Hespellia sp.]
MSKEVKILVACGSGVATSTIAQEAVKEIVQNIGVKAKIVKGTIAEVPDKQKDVDLVLTTANYRQPLDKPQMSVFGLVSGVNRAATEKKLADLLKELSEA